MYEYLIKNLITFDRISIYFIFIASENDFFFSAIILQKGGNKYENKILREINVTAILSLYIYKCIYYVLIKFSESFIINLKGAYSIMMLL